MAQLSKPHQPRAQWNSRMGFILAALGSAVGLGNIWRFSYLCYDNGGGAFLVPYFIALFIVGIPLLILEFAFGHKMRGSAPMSFAKLGRHWEWIGWWAVICAMFGIMLYYSTVIAWCLNYVVFAFDQAWGADPNAFFFKEFLQVSDSPGHIGNIRGPIILSLFVVWLLSWVIVFFGVQKGVERANKIFMPILFVLIGCLVIWSVNLEGAHLGLAVYLKPDFSLLKDPKIWIAAFSQIFFTLSLAFGIMIAYASYLPRKVNILQDACLVGIGNCLFSFVAGFAVFGTLGYMAFTTGKPVEEVVTQSIGLAFVTYPQAISLIPGVGSIFGVLFFTTLVVAGLSSAVSLVEAFASSVIDKFHYPRSVVVSVVCGIGFLGSIVFATQAGILWLDIVDHFLLEYGLVVVGILECLLIGWVFKAARLREYINTIGGVNTPQIWDFCIRFATPAVLIVLLINSVIKDLKAPYGGYEWVHIILIGRDWLIAALIAALFVSQRPWRELSSPDHK